jgi:hypothetical protein
VGTFVSRVGAVDFSTPVQVEQVPGEWATWGFPPVVESCTPQVLESSGATSITLSFNSSTTAGVEVEPADFAVEETIANFYDGTNLVGAIDLSPNGNSGALLFAASDITDPFTSIVITNLAGDEFALAEARTSSGTPEPATLLLVACGLFPLGFKKFRRS